ncbi:MAG: FecR family protein [bacterium]
MTDNLSEQQEQQLSDRFSMGVRTSADADEQQTFRAYRFVQDQLKSYPLPEPDTATLSQRMATEIGGRRRRMENWRFYVGHALKPAAVTVCIFCVIAGVGHFLFASSPVADVKFVAQTPSAGEELPFLWEHRLQQGCVVTVPGKCAADIELSDGSTIHCEPGTQIAVRVDKNRHVTLNSGEILVHAVRIANSKMSVETPLGAVEVVGTVFRVKVVR